MNRATEFLDGFIGRGGFLSHVMHVHDGDHARHFDVDAEHFGTLADGGRIRKRRELEPFVEEKRQRSFLDLLHLAEDIVIHQHANHTTDDLAVLANVFNVCFNADDADGFIHTGDRKIVSDRRRSECVFFLHEKLIRAGAQNMLRRAARLPDMRVVRARENDRSLIGHVDAAETVFLDGANDVIRVFFGNISHITEHTTNPARLQAHAFLPFSQYSCGILAFSML